MKKKTIYIWSGLILLVSVILALGFVSTYNPIPTKPVLAVSIQPQKYFLEKIVGDKYHVMCMLAQGGNPETYEPSFSHLINLERCDVYFKVGNIGFELAVLDKIKKNNPEIKIINTSRGIELLRGTHEGVSHDNCSVHAAGHNHEVDPHVWTSVLNAKIIAQNMYEAVIVLDSRNKRYYTQNYNMLLTELNKMEDEIAQQMAPAKGTAFAVWHPSLSYFARDYGLTQIAMENEGKEVPASVLKSGIDKARENNVRVMFFQKEFDNRQIQTISNQLGVELVEINPMSYDWALEIKKIANAITAK